MGFDFVMRKNLVL